MCCERPLGVRSDNGFQGPVVVPNLGAEPKAVELSLLVAEPEIEMTGEHNVRVSFGGQQL